ncbi:hypothetical protein B7463_g10696, partial [Scytalidium lignicola]
MLSASKCLLTGLLFLATLSSAFKFTEDHEDGIYFLTIGDDGNEAYTLMDQNLTDVSGAAPPYSARLGRRYQYLPSDSIAYCNPNVVDMNDFYQVAYNKFWSICINLGNTRVGEKQAVAAKSQTTVAYMCDYAENPCNVNEWWESVGWISSVCTGLGDSVWKQAGWMSIPSWKKSYGYDDINNGFC